MTFPLKVVFENLIEPVIVFDKKLKVVLGNRAVSEHLNLKNKSTLEKFHTFLAETIKPLVGSLTKKNTTIKGKITYQKNKSTSAHIKYKIILLPDAVYYVVMLKNGTLLDTKPKKLPQMLNYLQYIASVMPGNFYWKDKDGLYLGCNQMLVDTLGLNSVNEIVGKTDFDLWPEEAKKLRAHDRRVMKNKPAIFEEEVTPTNNPIHMYFTSTKVPLKDELGEVIGVIGNSLNITEKKRLEEALINSKETAELARKEAEDAGAANRAKNEFIANMSHDIRTPLSGMIGLSEILAKDSTNSEYKKNAQLLKDCSEELLNLLNGVLDVISAEDLKETDIQSNNFDIRKSLHHLENLFLPITKKKKINLRISISKKIPAILYGDHIKIERIILNLISNAIKFTNQGKIHIDTKWISDKSGGHFLDFTIKDTGIGISESEKVRIFDRFFCITPSYKKLYKGHGVGLYVVKKLVNLLNGQIDFKSEIGKGTVFNCLVPIQISEKDKITKKTPALKLSDYESTDVSKHLNTIIPNNQTPDETSNKKSHSKKVANPYVLVVEDESILFMVENKLLIKHDCKVDRASTGGEARELIKENQYDFVLMDVGLPDCSGMDVTRAIRKEEKLSKKRLPIIGLTAHATKETKQTCLDAGMDAVITKPLQTTWVKKILDSFVHQHKPLKVKQKPVKKGKLGEELPDHEKELFEIEHIPLLDYDTAFKRTGNKKTIDTIMEMLLNEAIPPERTHLIKMHAQRDWQAIYEIAHKLKSAGIYCGAEKMRIAAQYLERYWKSGYRDKLDPLYRQLLQVIQETEKAAKRWLKHTEKEKK